ncbi:MAG: glycosyltransferase family 39 protein [Anaerolineales bacterium]|nr:glycosyltransferase family 39 protein [Anaerolineales bacterium]
MEISNEGIVAIFNNSLEENINKDVLGNHPNIMRWEYAALIIILLIATFFRFHDVESIPPGPSHDELRMIELGELIVEGERPIHWTVSFSPEPLFMYLLALVMPVFGFTPFAARLVTRFAGILLISVIYTLTRRLFSQVAALVASIIMAITWWPVFFSRVALRGILLPLVFSLAVYMLWRGFDEQLTSKKRIIWFVLGGCLFGVSWYTFTAARGLVVLLPVIIGLISWRRWNQRKHLLSGTLVAITIAALIILPFIYDMKINPGAPEARLDQLDSVIEQLKTGNLIPLIKQSFSTLGMLAYMGDANWRYNVSGQPAFGVWLGILAFIGMLVCLVKWRHPQDMMVLFWFVLGCAPSALATDAPSFVRGIGALPPAAMLTGIGAKCIQDLYNKKNWQNISIVFTFFLLLLLLIQGINTYLDLNNWPENQEVRDIYQATLTEAFNDLDNSSLKGKIWISEPFPDDRHEMLADRMLKKEEIKIRWFNADNALLLPPDQGGRYYLFPDFSNPDSELFDKWMHTRYLMLGGSTSSYELFLVQGGEWIGNKLNALKSLVSCERSGQDYLSLPADFDGAASLLGYELEQEVLEPGQEIYLVVYWRAIGPIYDPISSFAHLIDDQDQIYGQYDGLDVPPRRWSTGDVIAQTYKFTINEDTATGLYRISIGLYQIQSMERVLIIDSDGRTLCDRLYIDHYITIR